MEADRERYARQLILDRFGIEGQEKLSRAKVLVIGAGGLGSPVLLYLCAAGVGTIGIVDGDAVELSNLQRQIIHSTDDLGRAKTESAKESLTGLNPETEVITYPYYLTEENADAILAGYDFVLDCTDGKESKYLINEACVRNGIPFCHAGVRGFNGHFMTVIPGVTPCLNCIFPRENAGPEQAEKRKEAADVIPVIGPAVGVIGSLQAMEAVNYLLKGPVNAGALVRYSGGKQEFRKIPFHGPQPECRICGKHSKKV